MSLSRRSFLRGILAAGAAPAIVKASSLMPVRSSVIALPAGAGAIWSKEFIGKELWPGVKEWYGLHYAEYGMPIAHYPDVVAAQAAKNALMRAMVETKEDIMFGLRGAV